MYDNIGGKIKAYARKEEPNNGSKFVSSPEDITAEWKCKKCGTKNYKCALYCKNCGTYK